MLSSKKIYLYRDFAAGVFLSEDQNPIPHLPHLLHTVYVYTVYLFAQGRVGGGGGDEPERMLKGQQFTKLGRKYQHD
jgi:hypothetical protein